MSKEIAKLLSKMFIARPDVMAIQRSNGDYNPVTRPFTMVDLLDHIEGRATYGHYLVNQDNMAKLFAFDIDLDKSGWLPSASREPGVWCDFTEVDPKKYPGTSSLRDVWHSRSAMVQRNYMKYQMRLLAGTLARAVQNEFGIQTAIAYSGNKGVHVYGFTGLLPAMHVREGAELILRSLGTFEPWTGKCFYKHKEVSETAQDAPEYGLGPTSHELSFRNFTVEVFPKQTEVEPGGYGNLMRLPLGKNLKNPKDPTMFLDPRGIIGSQSFMRRDPIDALTAKDQWGLSVVSSAAAA